MEGGSFKASKASVAAQLVGAKEVAEIIGVSRGTVTAYLNRKQMIEPLIVLACGPIWLRQDIERWHSKRPIAETSGSRGRATTAQSGKRGGRPILDGSGLVRVIEGPRRRGKAKASPA